MWCGISTGFRASGSSSTCWRSDGDVCLRTALPRRFIVTVLVTGGLGLVGIHTARCFAQQGHDVVCYDRKPLSPLAAAILGDAHRVEVVTGDIEDHARLEEIMRSRGVEGIIHAAAVVNEKICREEPLVAARVNIGGS